LTTFKAPKLTASVIVTTAADSGPGSLRDAVQGAPDKAVIAFDKALAGKTIALGGVIELSRSVTITAADAPGLTIDAQQKGGALHFNGDAEARIAIWSLRFINGRTMGSGGAISTNGGKLDLEVGGCSFEQNSAGEGGAIRVGYAHDSTTFIHDSVFSNNDGTLTNSGFSGGAISSTGTELHIARCRFEKNKGSTSGAVYAIHANPLVEDSVFLDNSSVGGGGTGALFVDGGGPGDDNSPSNTLGREMILRSRFDGNRGSGSDGGAVMLWGYLMDTLTIEDSVLHANQCAGAGKGGGAKLHARSSLRVARTAFVDNVSAAQGGGAWLDGEGPFAFENVLFSGNRAEGDRGGGATFNVSGHVDLSNVSFVGNAAGQGCGAFWLNSKDNDVHLRNSIVAFNTAKNSWEIQAGYPPIDEGGNIEWPDPQAGSRVAPKGQLLDPKLSPLTQARGTFSLIPIAGSPAIGNAVAPAPTTDLRGALRDESPDTGAFEAGATCK